MTKDELNEELKKIEIASRKAKNKVITEYCLSNNDVKVGDIIHDHIGYIKVEEISPVAMMNGQYSCRYKGVELKKNLQPKVKNKERYVYQFNLVKD